MREEQTSLTPKLSDAAPVAAMLAAESAEQAAWVTLGWRSLERLVRLVGEFHGWGVLRCLNPQLPESSIKRRA